MKKKFEDAGIKVISPHKIFESIFLGLGVLLFSPIFVVIPFICLFRIKPIYSHYRTLYFSIKNKFVYSGYQLILLLRFFIDHRKNNYSIVSGYHAMVCPLLYWIRILFHIPIYYTEISSPKWRSKTVDKIHDKKYLNSFDTIFVPSKLIGEELITYDGLIKTYTIIPFFIDLPPYCFATPNRTANTFGVIARLSDEKNQDVLIRVLKKVLIKNTNAQLILIGTGPKAQELRNLAHSLGISDQIVFISHFERVEDIIEYIDIVTLCSDAEGMPLTLLEALYFGKPIIGTSVGSIPDMVFNDYNGYIINKYEIDEIADRILKIMENSNLYCEMAINSRELYISKFHTESLFKKLLPYYENKY